MELIRYGRFLVRNLPLILGIAVVSGLVAGLVVAAKPAYFEAHGSLVLSLKDQRQLTDYDFDQFYTLQAAEISSSNVVSWLNSPDFVDQIKSDAAAPEATLRSRKNGGTIELTAVDADGDKAKAVIEAADRQIVARLQAQTANSPSRSGFVATPTPALADRVEPGAARAAGAATAAGLLVGLAIALTREGAGRRVRGADMLRGAFSRTIRARRGVQPTIDGHGLEPYRELREALGVDKGTILITDLTAQPGLVAFGLGIAVARAGRSVLLVDADLAGGRLHSIAGVPGTNGLNEVLAGGKLASNTQKTALAHLKVLPAGSPKAHVDVTAQQTANLVRDLVKAAEVVIVTAGAGRADYLAWHGTAEAEVVAVERDATRHADVAHFRRETDGAIGFWLG